MRVGWLIAGLLVTLGASAAEAQGSLAEARAELDAARFAEAVRLYDSLADARSGLERADLVALLRGRAMARAALRDREGARADLTALFSLDPTAQLGAEAPPSLTRLADEARVGAQRIALDVEASPIPDGFEIRSTVTGDAAGLVRAIRVTELRDGGVETHAGEVVRVVAEGPLRYVVEAIGGGGAVIASVGSPTAPRTIGASAQTVASEGASDDTGLWVGVGVGAGVAVALAVVLTLVFTLPSNVTQPGLPMEVVRP